MNKIQQPDSYSPYQQFFKQAVHQVREARTKAARSVNKQAISLYWWFGEQIVQHQQEYNWGKSVVERLSKDIKKTFPDAKFEFSSRNLWDMRRFYLEYHTVEKLRRAVAEIPWSQNLMILNKVKDAEERFFTLKLLKN